MAHLQNHMMENQNGVPGLLLIAISWILQFMHMMDRATITFVLSMISTIVAISYYLIKIYKELKKK